MLAWWVIAILVYSVIAACVITDDIFDDSGIAASIIRAIRGK